MIHSALRLLTFHRIRITFFVMAGLIALYWAEGRHPYRLLDTETPYGPLGVVLVLAGVFLRAWAAGVVHKNEELATSGPYSLTRHPLYVGSFTIAVGVFVVLGDLRGATVLLLLFLLLYLPKIRWEEDTLRGRYGAAWDAYCARTALVGPRTLRPSLRTTWSVRRWVANGEYRALVTALVVLGVLELLARGLD